jgi:hypothetical protein
MVDISADTLIQKYLAGDRDILPMPAPYFLYTFKVLKGPYLTPLPIMAPLQDVTIGHDGKGTLPSHLKGVSVQVGEEDIDPFFQHLSNHELSREEIIHVLGAWTETNGVNEIALVEIQGVSEEERLELMEGYSFIPVVTKDIEGKTTEHESQTPAKPAGQSQTPTIEIIT